MSTITSRRDFLRAVAAAPAIAIGHAVETRPNVLLLHCHDLGRFLHCYGINTVQTPNLDRLAEQSVLLENCFCAAPQCSPSRASMFTGRYPHANGVMGLTHADFAWDLHQDEKHLGQILKAAGYSTAGVGVIHETRSGPARIGLDDYSPNPRAQTAAAEAVVRLERFAQSPQQPFYMQVGFLEPHRLPAANPGADLGFTDKDVRPDDSLGVTVPPYLLDTPGTRLEIAELQGAVRHADQHMGRILSALEDLKLASHTLVIFTTDHGIAMPRAKCSVYEPGLQVASIWRLPLRSGWHDGIRKHEMISNVDYLPTILDTLGVALPANVQGRSFTPLLDRRAYTPRQVIFGELTYHDYYDPRRSVRTETHKLIVNFSSAPAFMDPSQSWRPRSDTVVPPNHALAYHPPLELYDLRDDPGETRNLATLPAYASVLADLQARLAEHLKDTGDPILDGAVTNPMHRRAHEWLKS
ncbi:MAG: sulfatase [Terriglobia bacterium]|jgi:arylsulfatase A-like enzyme